MRMMMTVTIPVEGGNKALKDGSLQKVMQTFSEMHKPEAAYFTTNHGDRTAMFFVDMKDPSMMPALGETFFSQLGAQVDFRPVMNAQDLKNGLEKLPR